MPNTITGDTQLYAIIGDPIFQVHTPEMMNRLFAREGLNAVMVAIHVAPQGFEAAVKAFRVMKNLRGFIATVPHKTAAAALCDELGETGCAIGAVNAVRREADGRLVGEMFDGTGFVAGLRAHGHDPAGLRVLLLGAGGAAAAMGFALAQAGVASLTIANRTRSKAENIQAVVRKSFPHPIVKVGEADPTGHDLIVNATSLGMKPEDPLPLDTALLTPDMKVAEAIAKPEFTPLLTTARAKGCNVHSGRHMLEIQASMWMDHWWPKESAKSKG